MKYQPKFKKDNPQNKEEKLICELVNNLFDVQKAFVRLNQDCKDHEIFIVMRDGSLGFAGQTIRALLDLMVNNSQKLFFLKECQDIFNSYIHEASENIK